MLYEIRRFWEGLEQREAKTLALAMRNVDYRHVVKMGWRKDGGPGECRAGGRPDGARMGGSSKGVYKEVYHGTTVAGLQMIREEGFCNALLNYHEEAVVERCRGG